MRRRFGRRERDALFVAAGGACSSCGAALPPGWHADHVRPWSRGGATDVANGQALCPRCNQQKGASMVFGMPEGVGLREWQRKAYGVYARHGRRDFLLVATPGAGKTRLALFAAMQSLAVTECQKLVVVVPTDALKRRWADEASRTFGVQLALEPSLAEDYDGFVATYQQVGQSPEVVRAVTARRPTFGVFDEIHHAGDTRNWGAGLRRAFEPAVRRLAITGTPFRSDSDAIPFVTYRDGTCVADFTYGYRDAVTDLVCREVYFPTYEGDLRWRARGGAAREATFGDALSEEDARRRLNTALDPNGAWLRQVIGEADAKLRQLRREVHPHAAGLVIAKDRMHAERVARLVAEVTGERPEVVTSDREDATEAIEAFRRVPPNDQLLREAGSEPKKWIVAVRMVSEGVDIPRLCVLVYATNIMTELYFRQAAGRIVRMQDGIDGQTGHMYIPADPTLVGYAEQIKEERLHALAEMQAAERAERARQASLGLDTGDATWSPLGAEARAGAVIWDGDSFTPEEIAEARRTLAECGFPLGGVSDIHAARLWRRMTERAQAVVVEVAARPAAGPRPLHERKREARRLLTRKVSRLVASVGREWFDHRFVGRLLIDATGCAVDEATEEQLGERLDIVDFWQGQSRGEWAGHTEQQWREEARNARQRA